MPVIIAAFLLGAVASPPVDDDDDAPPSVRSKVIYPKTDENDAKLGPPAKGAPTSSSDDDERDATTALPARSSAPEPDEDDQDAQPNSTIVVTAHRLDTARTQIDAGLGATVYSLTNDTIENRPGGETGSLADILTQAPGVTLSGTTLSLRGSPANQVRINNIILPEVVSDPADLLSSRLAETTRLITGTLPAQFGFAPAGVISVTTKNGLYQHGGQAEFVAASDRMFEPAFEWAGSAAAMSLFASGELERDRSRVGDMDGNIASDRQRRIDGLAFADYVLGNNDRLSLIFGGSHERQTIGKTSIGSGAQTNNNGYGVASYQHSDGGFTLQSSLFAAFASDLAQFTNRTKERRSSWGAQIDGSDMLGSVHTLRFGLLATRAKARELDPGGKQTNAGRTSLALYAQDEWKLAPSLTFNPGLRAEWLRGVNSPATLEPRASVVLGSASGLAAHLGYARYASAPAVGEVADTGLADERDDYFDAGVQRKLGALTLGVDGYSRSVHNYIDQHLQLGSAIATAFEFKRARIRGVELSATYFHHETAAWANVSIAKAEGRAILGGEGIFAPAAIAASFAHYVPLASERPLSVSGGVTQRLGRLSLGGDILLSSGAVRTPSLADPNGSRRSPYALFGLSAVYHARIARKPADLRVDLTNLTNARYALSDAANLEGGWTRWGRRRAITIGIEQGF